MARNTTSPIQKVRRNNLEKLIDTRFAGNVAAFSRACGKSTPLFHDIFADPQRKSFGERLARSIEEVLALPFGWLDEGAPEPAVRDPEITPSEDLFLLSVRTLVRKKKVPSHVMQTVLFLLDSSPDKSD